MDINEKHSLEQKLLGIIHQVRHRMDAKMRRYDKVHRVDPAHFPVMMNLRQHTYNVSELANRLKVSLPSMSKTVTALVKRGWVERVRQKEDRRVVELNLTQEGRAVLSEIRKQAESVMETMLAPMSAEEREHLEIGIDALSLALSEPLDEK